MLCLAGRCGGQGDSQLEVYNTASNLQASPDQTEIHYYKVLLWITALNTFNCSIPEEDLLSFHHLHLLE